MSKRTSSFLKGFLLSLLAAGFIVGSTLQVSAHPSMSPDPSNPKTCLVCHPTGAPGEETGTPTTPTTPSTPSGQPPSAPHPAPTSSDVVWNLYLAPYTSWDNAWDKATNLQLSTLDDLWEKAWSNLK